MAFGKEFNVQSLSSLVDETGAPAVSYIGYASAGNLPNPSAAVWTIIKFTDDGAGNTTKGFAGRNSDNDNVWDDRASLIYG